VAERREDVGARSYGFRGVEDAKEIVVLFRENGISTEKEKKRKERKQIADEK
jgi:hypothetical protein